MSTLEEAVAREKLRLLSAQVPTAVTINVVLAAGVSAIAAGLPAPTGPHFAWFAAVAAAGTCRMVVWLLFRRGLAPGWPWERAFAAGMALSGVAWGGGVFLAFASTDPAPQMAITATVVCLAAGIAGTTLGSALGVQLFAVLAIGPYLLRFALEPTLLHRVLAGLVGIFVVGTAAIASRNARSLTELLTLRFDLSAQRDRAERANRAKSAFLAAASHDLRQPLNAVVLFASALEGRLTEARDLRTYGNLRLSLDAMARLFDALLDISRLDAGAVMAKPRAVQLGPLLERLELQYAAQAEERGLSWQVDPSTEVVVTDLTLLETMLHNLISNALRYTSSGGVRITTQRVGAELRLGVTDTGIGIPAEEHAKVFTEFYQLHNPERDREKGLGLGLAIVERVASLLGQRVELISTPGEGSTFTVVLPLGREAELEPAAEPELPPGEEVSGLRALVIDDQEDGRESLRAALERWGCVVRTAESATEALALVGEGFRPELLITDYRLRGGRTGLEALAELRAQGLAAPALVVSGDVAPPGVSASGDQFMHKPLNPAKLRTYLRSLRRANPRG